MFYYFVAYLVLCLLFVASFFCESAFVEDVKRLVDPVIESEAEGD